MIDRLAHLTYYRRRLVLVVSGAILLGFLALAAGAFSVLKLGGFDDPASGSSQAKTSLDRSFGGQTNLVLLLTPEGGRALTDPAVTAAAAAVTGELTDRPGVTNVVSYWSTPDRALRSQDGTSALITMHVVGDESTAAKAGTEIIEQVGGQRGAIDVRAGGELGANHDVTEQVGADLALAEGIAIPVTLLLLILAFGSVTAALLPLGIGLVAIAGTFAELNILGHTTDVSTYAVNLTTALGLGLAIDYSLLIVNRFREELGNDPDVPGALSRTLHTAGRTVVFSSATVAVALAAMIIFPLYFLRSFAYAGIGVVLIAMLASLITLPAVLATLGLKVNSGRVLRRNQPIRPLTDASPFWQRTAVQVMRRPFAIGGPVIAVLLVLGIPFLHVAFSTPDDRVLTTSLASRQVGDILREDYTGGAASSLYVVISGNPGAAEVDAYAARLSRLPGVSAVQGRPGIWTAGVLTAQPSPRFAASGLQYLMVAGPADGASAPAQALVGTLRSTAPPAGGRVAVGGSAAQLVDSKAGISDRLPWAIAWIAFTTLVLLFLFTGSVLIPIKALLLNALNLSAVFGAMVWIFQDGHLSGILGFTPGPINTSMPVLLFCIAFGLSMDYEVFLLSRIKELHDAGVPNDEAVIAGMARTGRLVTTLALLLSVTFIAFGTSHVSFLQLFGIGTAIAILLDATVIRGVLVPAFMKVAGDGNWWAPGPLRRLHQRIGLGETPPAAGEALDRQPVPVA